MELRVGTMLSLFKRHENQIQALSADHSEKRAFSVRTDSQTNCLHPTQQNRMMIARQLPTLTTTPRSLLVVYGRPQAEHSACSDLAHISQEVTHGFGMMAGLCAAHTSLTG